MSKKYTCFCYCGVYGGEGHEVGAEKCTGSEWAGSVHDVERNSLCQSCNAQHEGECEIGAGQESIAVCEVRNEAKERGVYPEFHHPINSEKLSRKYKKIFEEEDRFEPEGDEGFWEIVV